MQRLLALTDFDGNTLANRSNKLVHHIRFEAEGTRLTKMAHPLALIRWNSGPSVPVIQQTEAAECGLACLAMIAGFHGHEIDLNTLRRRFPISLKGTSLRVLVDIARAIGLQSRPIKAELELLKALPCPAMLHWDLNHFVVLTGVRPTLRGLRFHINDPAVGQIVLGPEEISRHYTGVAVEIYPDTNFKRRSERAPFNITQLWSKLVGLKSTLVQIGVLSIALQLLTIAAPFYIQIAIDDAIPGLDRILLNALALGFLAIAILSVATSTLRDLVLVKLGSILGYQIVANLFSHLIRLPLDYFQKRHTGDVISRFDSTQPIVDMLSRGVMQIFIDGVLTLSTLALMFLYSVTLTAIAVVALLIYICVRLSYLNSLKLANLNIISARAAETSTMIETIRGIAAIKMFARESNRQLLWQNKRAAVVNGTIKIGRMQTWFDAANNLVIALENILSVYIAVKMVMDREFTIGMIFAFQSYKLQFTGAASRLADQWVQFRLVDMHLMRIADIALATPESTAGINTSLVKTELRGQIDVKGLSFAYGANEKPVLKNIHLSIGVGETVAIVGPSGSGKTTLMRLLLGFSPPTAGEIRIDGETLSAFGLQRYRTQIGAVLQDDVLYAGSISENISFFDAECDLDRVVEVAKLACIHDEIMAMPMSYDSLVGDMGSVLSGGQKQRILLARALYGRPKILFLDEGTAHLDLRTEAAVNAQVSKLGMTRVIIAHRPESLRTANRTIVLQEGQITRDAVNPAIVSA